MPNKNFYSDSECEDNNNTDIEATISQCSRSRFVLTSGISDFTSSSLHSNSANKERSKYKCQHQTCQIKEHDIVISNRNTFFIIIYYNLVIILLK